MKTVEFPVGVGELQPGEHRTEDQAIVRPIARETIRDSLVVTTKNSPQWFTRLDLFGDRVFIVGVYHSVGIKLNNRDHTANLEAVTQHYRTDSKPQYRLCRCWPPKSRGVTAQTTTAPDSSAESPMKVLA